MLNGLMQKRPALRHGLAAAIGAAVAVIALDQLSKYLVVVAMDLRHRDIIDVFPGLSFRMAWNTGSATPSPRPTSARTASTSRFTHGMPSGSAPRTPARRSTARSTDTVVCDRARSTTGRPAFAASRRALRTTRGSRFSFPATLCSSCRPLPGRFVAAGGDRKSVV